MRDIKTTDVMPSALRIEASSLCQLRCRCCPNTAGIIEKPGRPSDKIVSSDLYEDDLNPWLVHAGNMRKNPVGHGFLRFDDYKNIIDSYPRINRVELSNWGEMFLNPQLDDIIKYSFRRRVILTADNGVNLNFAPSNILESIVKYKFTSLSVSLSAASNEVYKQYNVGGDMNIVIENIRKINEYKLKYRSGLPIMHWQFVIFGHNEHEIDAARKMARDLKMYFLLRLNVSNTYSSVKNKEIIRKKVLGGYSSREEYYRRNNMAHRQKIICSQLWNSPQINWDGRLLGCCLNYWDDFGNVLSNGIQGGFNSERMIYARNMLRGRAPAREDIPCYFCLYYKMMKKTGNWISMPEIYLLNRMYSLKYRFIRYFQTYYLPGNYTT